MITKDLFDTNASLYVLSCLMHDPLLLQDERYAFCESDFFKPLQKMVFFAIYNMAQEGVQKIQPNDIDLYLSQYESQYEFYKKEKGFEFVNQCYQTAEGSDEKQFNTYYNRLKKFSFLRDLESIGIDTKMFYDTEKDPLNRDKEDEKLNKMSLNSIPERLRSLLIEIENRHIGKDQGTSQEIGKGLRTLVNTYKETPEVGLPLDGDIINYATRGARRGKLYTYSAPSGAGKTRYMVGNACAISMPYIDEGGKIVFRGTIEEPEYQKVLFVTTEQTADEIQTMVLAYVSGVNEKNILFGNYTPIEQERIDRALDIIDKFSGNFIVEAIPDPSIAMVKAKLAKYIIQDDVNYIFYDYIFSSPGLLTEFRDVAVREDVALMMLSNSLKETAMMYNVFIQSATQLNDGWSKKATGLRDQNCIRGSKAIADKIDVGLIGVRVTEDEWKEVEALWNEWSKGKRDIKLPNVVVDVYKNRRGEINCCKIWRYFDYATCRSIDYYITDAAYKTVSDIGQLQFNQRPFDYLDLKTRGVL